MSDKKHYVKRKAIMLNTGDLQDLSADFQRAEISSGTHTPNSTLYSLSGYCIGSLALAQRRSLNAIALERMFSNGQRWCAGPLLFIELSWFEWSVSRKMLRTAKNRLLSPALPPEITISIQTEKVRESQAPFPDPVNS